MENYTHDMMDDLLVKYLADEATPPEQAQVESWIAASENNRTYFQQMKSIWDDSEALVPVHGADENKAWHRFQRRIHNRGNHPAGRSLPIPAWRIAAAILVLFSLGWAIRFFVNKETAPAAVVTVASINEVKRDTLPDGSVATLNKHSDITYSKKFRGKTRNVKLKGEAFFNVQPNKEKPFIIDVNDVTIKVVGTSFNVRSEHGATEVIVETGVVLVSKGGQTIELKPGERITLDDLDSAMHKESTRDKLYKYYVSKTFVCDNTPLWKLVEKLNEAYGTHIRIGRPGLRKLPLNVTFDDESLDVILDIISQTFMIKVSKGDHEIVLE